jgi:hypothetical protein
MNAEFDPIGADAKFFLEASKSQPTGESRKTSFTQNYESTIHELQYKDPLQNPTPIPQPTFFPPDYSKLRGTLGQSIDLTPQHRKSSKDLSRNYPKNPDALQNSLLVIRSMSQNFTPKTPKPRPINQPKSPTSKPYEEIFKNRYSLCEQKLIIIEEENLQKNADERNLLTSKTGEKSLLTNNKSILMNKLAKIRVGVGSDMEGSNENTVNMDSGMLGGWSGYGGDEGDRDGEGDGERGGRGRGSGV